MSYKLRCLFYPSLRRGNRAFHKIKPAPLEWLGVFMSRYILGDSVQVMAGYPANSIDFILTDPLISLVIPTAVATALPMTKKMTGCCGRRSVKCSGCPSPTVWR